MNDNRGNWKSSMGFVLATAGSAIGVGNLWRFPYLMGENGGFWFLLCYLAIIILLGVPVMLGEITIGRYTQKSPVEAYSKIQKGSGFIGVIAVFAPFLLMTYYGIVGGWALRYMFAFIFHGAGVDFVSLVGGSLAAGAWQPVLWTFLFVGLTWFICIFGTSGIEKASKVMMPLFFVVLMLVVIRSVTLPGAGEGLKFMFANSEGFTIRTIPMALGQAFFSMSLASGVLITFGSYLKKDAKMPKTAMTIAGLDTLAAVLAGMAIFPAVFAMGGSPGEGTGLAFTTLPATFEHMPMGRVIGAAFFLLLSMAALTSSISLTEACCSFTIDTLKWKRKTSVTGLCVAFCLLSIPNSMSLAEGTVFSGNNFLGTGKSIFQLMDYITGNILLPVSGLLMCIFIGWFWKPKSAIDEIESTPGYVFKQKAAWSWIIKFLAPILILIVLIFPFIEFIPIFNKYLLK
ncbi:MAG: sodium-dependent transporter [Oscillospiraceae bacterium]|nr:sodium-dependent transporter [Oscillospiraceae bacterium]